MIAFLALLGALSVASPCDTGVCTCMRPPDAPSALERSTAAFTGTVVAVRDTMIPGGQFDRHVRKTTLRVHGVWKGVESATVDVLSANGGSTCDFRLRNDASYLVFAQERDGFLVTWLCSRTTLLSRAEDDLRALGEPVRRW
ncbi:MAG TPA: hypothetical protein VHG93_10730 [Longimicrobium sp.]|nr:hypothetical protein [Longimicrobium sp.]